MLPNQRPFKNPLLPAEVRFRDVHVEPWAEGGRVRVHITLAPFQKPPNIEVAISTTGGEEVASASIIETMTLKSVFTMHLRGAYLSGEYHLTARLYYPDMDDVDHTELNFGMPSSGDENNAPPQNP